MSSFVCCIGKAGAIPETLDRDFSCALSFVERKTGLAVTHCNSSTSMRIANFTRNKNVPFLVTDSYVATAIGWVFSRNNCSLEASLKGAANLHDALDGQFVAIHGSVANQSFTIVGDVGGLFPFYVCETESAIWGSTCALALATLKGDGLDRHSVSGLLMGVPVRTPRSLFSGVRRIAGGEKATLSPDGIAIERYWLPFFPQHDMTIEAATEEGCRLLVESCEQVNRQYAKAICDLTSGLDTRLLVSAMSCVRDSLDVTVNGPRDHIDVVGARQIADSQGWNLRHTSLPKGWGKSRFPFFVKSARLLEGELPATSADAMVRIKEGLSDSFDATCIGGGGELYREFPWEHVVFRRGSTSRVNLDFYAKFRLYRLAKANQVLFAKSFKEEFIAEEEKTLEEIIDLSPDSSNTAKFDALYLWRCTGHFGRYAASAFPLIPSINPLMTRSLIEFCLSQPASFRSQARLIRHMITKCNSEIARLPTCWGGSAEPMGLKHFRRSVPYWKATTKRWVNKSSSILIRRNLFRDAFEAIDMTNVNRDFVTTLKQEGFLSYENLKSAELYGRRLVTFLRSAQKSDFRDFEVLYRIATIEQMCRDANISPDRLRTEK